MKNNLLYFKKNRRVTWLELFFDLIFVVLISKVTHFLAHVHHGSLTFDIIIKFVLFYIFIWWIWTTQVIYNNIYDSDNKYQRFMTLFIMLLMIILSLFININLEKSYMGFLIIFSIIRMCTSLQYFKLSGDQKTCREYSLARGKVYIIGMMAGLLSLFLPSPHRYWLLSLSILLEFILIVRLERKLTYIKIDTEHLLERIGLLTIILLGESILSIVTTLERIDLNSESLVSAISGFILIGSLWWIYFDSFSFLEKSKKFKKSYKLLITHLVLTMGLSILANVIRQSVLKELDISYFKIMLICGLTQFYIGKQLPYSMAFPKFRKQQFIIVFVVVTLTSFSLFFKSNMIILLVTNMIIFLSIYLNYKYILKSDKL